MLELSEDKSRHVNKRRVDAEEEHMGERSREEQMPDAWSQWKRLLQGRNGKVKIWGETFPFLKTERIPVLAWSHKTERLY